MRRQVLEQQAALRAAGADLRRRAGADGPAARVHAPAGSEARQDAAAGVAQLPAVPGTAMKKLRIARLGFGTW